MALIDNPLLQAVGDHLGLSSVFEQAAQNAAIKPGVSKPSPSASKGNPDFATFRYMQRMMSPHSGEGHTSGASPSPQGEVNPAGVNDPQTQALLAQFGQSGQVQADPNLFIHNPTAHPILGNLLDHALTGLAYTTGDPSNPGAIAHNVAAGLLAGNQARQAQVNSQMEMPFAQAAQVAGLQKAASSLQTMQDQQAELHARTNADNARADKDARPVVPPEHNPEWAREQAYFDTFTNNAVAANGGKPLNDTQKQKAFDDATQQLSQDKAAGRPVSPMGKAVASAEDAYRAANPDATSIPPEVYASLYGQIAGAKAKATAPYKKTSTATLRDPLLNPRVAVLKQSYQDLNHQLGQAQNSPNPITDDQGHLLLFGTPARAAYAEGIRKQRDDAQQQLKQILYPNGATPQSAAPAAGAASNSKAPSVDDFKGANPGQLLPQGGAYWALNKGRVIQVDKHGRPVR